MDAHQYPNTMKLYPELRHKKPEDATLFVLGEVLDAMKHYTMEPARSLTPGRR